MAYVVYFNDFGAYKPIIGYLEDNKDYARLQPERRKATRFLYRSKARLAASSFRKYVFKRWGFYPKYVIVQ